MVTMKKSTILIISSVIIIFLTAPLRAEIKNSNFIFRLDSISDKYEPVKFNHTRHISIAGDCGICHHQHGNSGTLPCKDCHSVDKSVFRNSVVNGFMACKNCHGDLDRSNPGIPSLKTAYHSTCFKCHRGIGSVGTNPKGCTQMCHEKKRQTISMKSKKR